MLSKFLGLFKYHKKKIFLFFIFLIISLYFVFPFNDLGDLVTAKVAESTGSQIYVGFDQLNLSIIPSPGIALTNVILETPFLPSLKAGFLSASPNILGLLTFKPGISVRAEKLLGGDVSLSTRGGEKNKNGNRKQKISLDFEDVKLLELFQLLDLNIRMNGIAEGTIDSVVDVDLIDQPKGEMAINLNKVILEETDLNIQNFPISIPKISLNKVNVEAQADGGSLQILKFGFGGPGQDLTGSLTGRIALTFLKQGAQIMTQPGSFDLNLKFQISEALKQKLSSYLALLQNYMVAQNTYSLHLVGANFYGVPQITKGP